MPTGGEVSFGGIIGRETRERWGLLGESDEGEKEARSQKEGGSDLHSPSSPLG